MRNTTEIGWGNFKSPLIITGGIGIFTSLALLLFSFIGDVVFIGLISIVVACCFVVAYRSSIDSIEATVNGLVLKFNHQEEQVAAISAKETEPMFKLEAYGTDDDTKSVIKALGSSNYTFRNIEGMVLDTSLPENTVISALNWLIANNLAMESSGVQRNVYSLTPKGRAVFASSLIHV